MRVIADFATVFVKDDKHDAETNRKDCPAECNQLWHGRLAPCNQMMYVKYFNDYYNENMPEEVPIEDISSVKDFESLEDLLAKPMEICSLCNVQRKSQPFQKWERMKPGGKENNSIEKWFV